MRVPQMGDTERRMLALRLASELPLDRDDAARVIDLLREIYERFLSDPDSNSDSSSSDSGDVT